MENNFFLGVDDNYPRGFLLSNTVCNVPSNYSKVNSLGVNVYVDSRTHFVQAERGCAHVLVFGVIVDNECPANSPADIALDLVRALGSGRDKFFSRIGSMGGRHAIVCRDPDGLFVVGDAGGARSVFYRTKNGVFFVASHAHLLATQVNAPISEFASNIQSLGTAYRARNWPGRQSMFQGVLQLTPNTYLNIDSGRVSRFFGKDLPPLRTARDAAEIAYKMLLNSVSAFCKHYLCLEDKALIFLTSGIDSRLVAGCFKNDLDKASALTYWLSEDHDSDVAVARKVAGLIGIDHHQVLGDKRLASNFNKWFEINGANVYVGSRSVIGGIAGFYKAQCYNYSVRGNLGEISRGVFMSRPAFVDQPPRFMARNWYRGSDKHQAVIDCFKDFSDAVEMDSINWPIRILYYWEHKHATWFAATLNEMDIAFDTYCPMNSRNIIEAMCGVSDEDQKSGMVQKELIAILNEQLLDIPINPEVA